MKTISSKELQTGDKFYRLKEPNRIYMKIGKVTYQNGRYTANCVNINTGKFANVFDESCFTDEQVVLVEKHNNFNTLLYKHINHIYNIHKEEITMTKIIFYNPNLEEKVNKFIDSLNQPIDPKKEQFITFDMISARTGITIESETSSIVSAIISVISMVNANIFVPFIERIEKDIITYVNRNKDNINPIDFFYINSEGFKDSINIELTEDKELEYTMFVPKIVSILYIAPTSRIEKEIMQLTPNSRFVFDIARIKEEAKIEDDTRIAMAFPQIAVSSTITFCKVLEDTLRVNPVDLIIYDHEGVDHDDVLMDMIYKYISNSNFISRIHLDTKAYSIEEFEQAESLNDDDSPTITAEVIE